MSLKDEYIEQQNKQKGKITFAINEYGHVTHIVKRVDPRLFDVYSHLKALHSVNLPVIIDLIRKPDCLEVHEEYIRGRTLEQVRQENGTLDDGTLLDIAADVCRALIVMHGAEPPVIHRDIKPENIMQREDGGYVLIDFDASRIYRNDAETDTKCIATVGYAAPEQYGLSQTDVRSDLFSLGATLYELKTGEAYHMNAVCPGKIGRIIAKCTAFEPKKRFQSARQLLNRLEALRPEKARSVNGTRIFVASLVCVTAVSVFLAVYFGTRSRMLLDVPAEIGEVNVTPSPVPASALSAKDIPCTCRFGNAALTTDKGLIVKFDGEPITLYLKADGEFDRVGCAAEKHIEEVGLIGCRIDDYSLGALASVTDDGMMTVDAAGVYRISGFVTVAGETGEFIKAMLVVTDAPEAYTECKCALDVGPETTALHLDIGRVNATLPADGSMLDIQMHIEPFYIDRLCSSNEHVEIIPMHGYVENAPEGANCGVTEDNRFYTDTAGSYDLFLPAFFRDEITIFGCSLLVQSPG